MQREKQTKKKTVRRILLITVIAITVLIAVSVGIFLINAKPAMQSLSNYQSTFPDTTITVNDVGDIEILPKNGDTDTGLIFYVGAQIEPDAYIPLMAQIAEHGYTCFIPDLTLNMAPLEYTAAEKIIESNPKITSWYIAGHSMGGLSASGFADDHRSEIDGLIFIASYTNRDMKDADIPTLSIFGDTDGVLNYDLYNERKDWNPPDFEEHIINGANHAQFGDYGVQPGDFEAKITGDDQRQQAVTIILDWLYRHEGESSGNE